MMRLRIVGLFACGVGLVVLIVIGWARSFAGNQGRIDSTSPQTIRVAVIGGMVETGFWATLSERFQRTSAGHYKVEIVASGPKQIIADAFKRGEADLITMHASDTIINLVADGYAVDPHPWLKNDLVIVGPPDDPAGIRNAPTAAAAFAKIVTKQATFVVHASLGAQEVMRDVLHTYGIEMPSDKLIMLFTDRARDVLKIAAEKHAYTLVGRIPFRNGKLPNEGLELMVQGDPLLRRPYVVAVANLHRFPDAHIVGATQLAEFLRTETTQEWISNYGRGVLDDQPLFFRVARLARNP